MKTVIFSPCGRRGGLDVAWHSVASFAGHDSQLIWLVGDELYAKRRHLYDTLPDVGIEVHAFDTKILREPGDYRSLARAYKKARQFAVAHDADLLVSLQDYIIAPVDGIARFEEASETGMLLTGLTSIAKEPTPAEVVDPNGLWSVFDSVKIARDDAFAWYQPTRENMHWYDVRDRTEGLDVRDPVEWETNWAAIPKVILEDERVQFDTEYDKGCAYENQSYSFAADRVGYGVLVDQNNHAISLNHKSYFPEEERVDIEHSNQEFHQEKWS